MDDRREKGILSVLSFFVEKDDDDDDVLFPSTQSPLA
jgi:hypothetical protein